MMKTNAMRMFKNVFLLPAIIKKERGKLSLNNMDIILMVASTILVIIFWNFTMF